MNHRASIFWAAIAGLFLTALTMVGSEVRLRDQRLAEIHAAIERERESIHVLKAERAYLASAERIGLRATRDLGLKELTAGHVVSLADLPLYAPTPRFELQPNQAPSLLLSGYVVSAPDLSRPRGIGDLINENEAGGLIAAAFLPPPRLESASTMRDTAWVLTRWGAQPE